MAPDRGDEARTSKGWLARAEQAEAAALRREVAELRRRIVQLERTLEVHRMRWEASEVELRRRLLVDGDRRVLDVRGPEERSDPDS